MLKIIQYIILGVVSSFFLFPVEFNALPLGLNTKIMLAGLGGLLVLIDFIKQQNVLLSKYLIVAVLIALVFSLCCMISLDINQTTDYSYVTYVVSMLTWLLAAYSTTKLIYYIHGYVNFKICTIYLAGVCLTQCILAIAIDRIPELQMLVDSIFRQGQEFFQEVDRLYGIGAALDTAGVRFSVVLPMISVLMLKDESVKSDKVLLTFLIISFFIIIVLGNAIARTTTVGAILALALIVYNSKLWTFIIDYKNFTFFQIFIIFLILVIGVSTFLYQTDESFYRNMRFAFEGFFKWVEKGEWETGSTNKLNSEMWIWPTTTQAWIIGTGVFGSFEYGTDVGYCRFILYCGVIGFSAFSLFFIYLAFVFAKNNIKYWDLFFVLLCLTFIVWVKVSTDIFLIYALFFGITMVNRLYTLKITDEDSILHN